jgi:peptidoglycan glycosyltransferase
VGINRAIGRLTLLFIALYVVLATRQVWIQAIAGPQLADNVHNPRSALLSQYRGSIVARDGTVLAASNARGRVYPLGRALAQTVGYVSARYGTSGLESVYEAQLAARAAGNDPWTQLLGIFGRAQGPARGQTLVTTIDPAIERTLYDSLSAYPRAAGIALDPRSGEVLAIASVPSFDPQRIDASFAALSRDASSPLLNRAIDGLYPPGSTFKIVTVADALDAGVVSLDSTFEDPGSYQVGNFVVHDDEGEATGRRSLAGAFALSSNVDFAQIALALGADRWFEYAARWRLGEPLDFTLATSRDHLPARDSVTPSILAQLGFGQADLLVTPLRMALVAATIAEAGATPHPTLVRVTSESPPLANPIDAEIAGEVRDLMSGVVANGTGTAAALPALTVAGKTGTATNPAGRSHAWFVAFAPAESPRVAVAIVVENAGYGGAVAAPIARRVLVTALHLPRGS